METLDRFFSLPKKSFFLLGPRGTGKSTWLRKALPDALVVDLLLPDVLRKYSARPERLIELATGDRPTRTIVLDEVQRAPELLATVHHLIESDKRRRFVLTGSSARKLRRGGADLLGGRALSCTMHPFMAAELPEFSLERALKIGMLPLVVGSEQPSRDLRAYASLYLEQEIRTEGWVRKIGDFARFLEVITFSHGAVLNVANVARECSIERNTAAGYIEVLEDLLLAFTLPVFTRRAKRATIVHPKFYLFDAGVFRSLRPRGPMDRATELEGAALEGLVAQHLRAWLAYSETDTKLSFWRTRDGSEVDFVVYGEAGFWAIQVQNSTDVRPADLRPLKSFREDYPECTAILLHRGEERFVRDDVWCLPVADFLRELVPGRAPTLLR